MQNPIDTFVDILIAMTYSRNVIKIITPVLNPYSIVRIKNL